MSNDGMMLLTISGVTPEEFFKRFGEVAQRFGYVLGPVAEAVREAEFNLPEAVTIGEGGIVPLPSTGRLNPKKRRRRTVAQIEADRAAALTGDYLPTLPDMKPVPSDDPPVETAENFAEHDPPLTIADVKLAGGRLLQASNGDPVPLRELLASYGVARMTPLPEEYWAEFIAKCDLAEATKKLLASQKDLTDDIPL